MNMEQKSFYQNKNHSNDTELTLISMANDSGFFADDLTSSRGQDNNDSLAKTVDDTCEVSSENNTGGDSFCSVPFSNENMTLVDGVSSLDVEEKRLPTSRLKGLNHVLPRVNHPANDTVEEMQGDTSDSTVKEVIDNNNEPGQSKICIEKRRTKSCDESNCSDLNDPGVRRKKTSGYQGDNTLQEGFTGDHVSMHGDEDQEGYRLQMDEMSGGPRDQLLGSGHDVLANIYDSQYVHIGTQKHYHVHIDGNVIQVLQEGNNVLVNLPENVKMRISIEGPGLDQTTRDRMDEQIMEDLRDPSTGLLSTLISGIQTISSRLLNLFQVSRGCIELVLVSQSKDAVEEFKKKIRNGELTDEVKKLLISENVKKLAKGADFGLKIDIIEEEIPKDNEPPVEWADVFVTQIKNKNIDGVLKMLTDNVSPNVKDESGFTAMTHAAESGCVEILQLLKTKGGDVTGLHPVTRETLLHSAVRSGSIRMVEYVLPFCHPDQPIGDLYTSDFEGHTTNALIDINAFSSKDKTALQLASEKGSLSIVKLLVGAGATSLIVNHTGALHSAAFESIQAWLERVRRARSDKILACINDNENGLKCLKTFWQAPYDHLLVNKLAETPLMYAAKCSRLDIVEFLLESAVYEARETMEQALHILNLTNAEDEDQDIDTIFIHGVKDNGPTFFCSMSSLDSGCPGDVNETLVTNNSVTYLSHVRATDRRGKTALHYAIDAGDEEINVKIASCLLKTDPSVVNKQDKMGRTPLHIASTLLRKNMAKVLLRQKHVNVNLRDHLDWLPDEVCPLRERSSIVKMIRKVRLSGPREEFSDNTSTNTEGAHSKKGVVPSEKSILSRYLDDYGLNDTSETGVMDSGLFDPDPDKYQNMGAYTLTKLNLNSHNKGFVKKKSPFKTV